MPHVLVARPTRWLHRLPLPLTATATVLLLLVPALWLHRHPRPQAQGLERVLAASALLQSFTADPRRPVPGLWRQRLGAEPARRLWLLQRGNWWQFWGRHGDGGLYLVLPAASFKAAGLPPPAAALRVDDLRVLAPSPLAAQILKEPLALKQWQPRGLERRCLTKLQGPQAVYWTDSALGQMLGPLSSLMQSFQQGCMELGSQGGALLWQGEATGTPGALSVAPPPTGASPESVRPLATDRLLEVRGDQLDLLLQDLLNRQMVREPLASRYGIADRQLALLRRTPFLLRLRPLPKGPFLAGLELQLAVGDQRRAWAALLPPLRKALIDQGLMESNNPQIRSAGSPLLLPTSTWERDDGTVVGGWRWVTPADSPVPQLLFFLGPEPSISPQSSPWPDARSPRGARFVLQARPLGLARLGLLPGDLPLLVRRARELTVVGGSGGGADKPADSTSLRGSLRLGTQAR
ncbi:MAG: hypothetical protein WCK64_02680 [Synechococcaceae cyanobacterium ELA445]